MGCPAEDLFPVVDPDAEPPDPLFKLDAGAGLPDARTATVADAGAVDGGALDAGVKLVWVRVPSAGAVAATADGARVVRVRVPPPTSHGAGASPERNVGSTLSGRTQGGTR